MKKKTVILKTTAILIIIVMLFGLASCGNSTQRSISSTENDTSNAAHQTNEKVTDVNIKINGKSFTAELYDNETAMGFAKMLPMTAEMRELNGNEKFYYLSSSLPTDLQNVGQIEAGDIMLYGDDCIVLFYESFSTPYSYTKIGYITNPSGLAEAVGDGNVSIVFE